MWRVVVDAGCCGVAVECPQVIYCTLLAVTTWSQICVSGVLHAAAILPSSCRVNHSSEPGTVLEAHSAQEAADILSYLLKRHAAAVAAAVAAQQVQQQQQQQQQEEELPPLPPEPPPAGDWAPSSSGRAGKPPTTPAAAAAAGAGPSRQQQQQQQHGWLPIAGLIPIQQQGQAGGYGTPAGGLGADLAVQNAPCGSDWECRRW